MRKLTMLALAAACAVLASPAAQAQAQTAVDGNQAFFDRLCADHGEVREHAKFSGWVESRLNLNDAQMAAFTDFQEARAKSLSDSKAKLCADKPDLTSFEARLVFNQKFAEARLDALKAENPKLIAFYNSLDEKQKKTFDEIRSHARR